MNKTNGKWTENIKDREFEKGCEILYPLLKKFAVTHPVFLDYLVENKYLGFGSPKYIWELYNEFWEWVLHADNAVTAYIKTYHFGMRSVIEMTYFVDWTEIKNDMNVTEDGDDSRKVV